MEITQSSISDKSSNYNIIMSYDYNTSSNNLLIFDND